MEKYMKEIVWNNVIDELERAKERIIELGEFSDACLTPDEELVQDIMTSLDRLNEMVGELNES